MADNISINFEELEYSIETTVSDISGVQTDINAIYGNLTSVFAESAGEEAEALRDQLAEENKLVQALSETLGQFAESIRFAAGELQNLDQTGAAHMQNK